MPNYSYATRSPYGATAALGDGFSDFMLNLAQLKAREKAAAEELTRREKEFALEEKKFSLQEDKFWQDERQFVAQKPMWDAQASAHKANAAYDTERTAASVQARDNAQNAGLAAFGANMASVPGYDGGKTSFLPNTPATREAIYNALMEAAITQAGVSDPDAAARMSMPVEVNRGAVLMHPRTGKQIGKGVDYPAPEPRRYNVAEGGILYDKDGNVIARGNPKATAAARPTVLARGAKMFSPDGKQIAENPDLSTKNGLNLVSLANSLSDNVGNLSRDPDGLGPAYKNDPLAGKVYTNSVEALDIVLPHLLRQIKQLGTNTQALDIDAEVTPDEGGPQPGDVEDGYRFLGGDPADPKNWEEVK